ASPYRRCCRPLLFLEVYCIIELWNDDNIISASHQSPSTPPAAWTIGTATFHSSQKAFNTEKTMKRLYQHTAVPQSLSNACKQSFARTFAHAALCIGGLFAASPAVAQEYDLTMSVIVSPGDGYSILTQSVPERVRKATNGKVKVTVSDSLVPAAQIATAIREGRVDMSAALHTYLAADEPRMGIFNLPGLINNVQEYKKVGDAFWFEDTKKIWK